jgi:alpha-L-fucosidase
LLWPSTATVKGSVYNYSVVSSPWRGGKGDVVAEFQKSCEKYGMGLGYYYSIRANEHLQQQNVSEADHASLVLQNLQELWGPGSYGNNGNLTELWFDGGIALPGVGPEIKALVAKYQPQTVSGACEYEPGNLSTLITENPVRAIIIYNIV